jgi:hypothetical protein
MLISWMFLGSFSEQEVDLDEIPMLGIRQLYAYMQIEEGENYSVMELEVEATNITIYTIFNTYRASESRSSPRGRRSNTLWKIYFGEQ